MAINFVQPGHVLTLEAPSGGVVSGGPVVIGSLVVIALGNAAEGEMFEGQLTGVWTLPKTSAQAWTVGVDIYWTGSAATTTASGNTKIGVATAAAENPSATGVVRLLG